MITVNLTEKEFKLLLVRLVRTCKNFGDEDSEEKEVLDLIYKICTNKKPSPDSGSKRRIKPTAVWSR